MYNTIKINLVAYCVCCVFSAFPCTAFVVKKLFWVFKNMKMKSLLFQTVISIVASRQKALGSIPPSGRGLVWSLHGFSPGTPASSHSPRHAVSAVRLISNSKLAKAVNVSVDSCLSLCVNPAIDWQLFQGVLCPPRMTLTRVSGRGWTDGNIWIFTSLKAN